MKYYNIIILIIIVTFIYLTRYYSLKEINDNDCTEEYYMIEKYEITSEDREDINFLLAELVKILNNNNITYWIIAGTLLGSIRHGEIIPWDDDADIAIFDADINKLIGLNSIINKNGFEIVKHWKLYKFRRIGIKYPFIDIFGYQKDGNRYIMNDIELTNKWPQEYFYDWELFPLKYYKFGSGLYNGPNYSLDFLDRVFPYWYIHGIHTFDHKDNTSTNIKIILNQSNPEHKLKQYYYVNPNENIFNIYNQYYNEKIIISSKNSI